MSTKLFVGGLSPKTTTDQLTRFFSSAGLVVSVRMPLDRGTGRPRGFAFVEFQDQEHAEQAMKVFNGRELGGSLLRVSIARPEGDNSRGRSRSFDTGQNRRSQPEEAASFEESLTGWRPSKIDDPYGEDLDRHPRHHGRHGSDRKRRHGTRRYLD